MERLQHLQCRFIKVVVRRTSQEQVKSGEGGRRSNHVDIFVNKTFINVRMNKVFYLK